MLLGFLWEREGATVKGRQSRGHGYRPLSLAPTEEPRVAGLWMQVLSELTDTANGPRLKLGRLY